MAVLGYQLTIVVTLILVRLISPKRLQAAALVWTVLTVVNLFFPPLIVLQLIVIWVTYSVLKPSDPPPEPQGSALEHQGPVKAVPRRDAIDLTISCRALPDRPPTLASGSPTESPVRPPAAVPTTQSLLAPSPAPAAQESLGGPASTHDSSSHQALGFNEQAARRQMRPRGHNHDIQGAGTFSSFQEALAWAKENPGRAITRMPGTEGFAVKPSAGSPSINLPSSRPTPAELTLDLDSSDEAMRPRRETAAPCTTVEGSVTIRTSQDWEALIAGGCTAITGDLNIRTPGLTHLPGVVPISSIGGNLDVRSTALASLDLPALTAVGGHLFITENSALTSLNLPALSSVSEHLEVHYNGALTKLRLPGLLSVGGHLLVYTNPALTSISLPALTCVSENLEVHHNDALTSLDLPALRSVVGNLFVAANRTLTNLSLPALATVRGERLGVSDTALKSLHLPKLSTVDGHLLVFANDALTDVDLSELTEVGGNLEVHHNKALTSLSLPELTTVSRNLLVHANTALTNPSLPALAGVEGILGVFNNEALTDLHFPALTTVSDNLQVYGSASLTSLRFAALTTVGKRLAFHTNAALANLSLEALTIVGADLAVFENATLTSLSLSELTAVGGDLIVLDNVSLTSLNLPALTTVNGALKLRDNAALPDCQVAQLRVRLGLEPEGGSAEGSGPPREQESASPNLSSSPTADSPGRSSPSSIASEPLTLDLRKSDGELFEQLSQAMRARLDAIGWKPEDAATARSEPTVRVKKGDWVTVDGYRLRVGKVDPTGRTHLDLLDESGDVVASCPIDASRLVADAPEAAPTILKPIPSSARGRRNLIENLVDMLDQLSDDSSDESSTESEPQAGQPSLANPPLRVAKILSMTGPDGKPEVICEETLRANAEAVDLDNNTFDSKMNDLADLLYQNATKDGGIFLMDIRPFCRAQVNFFVALSEAAMVDAPASDLLACETFQTLNEPESGEGGMGGLIKNMLGGLETLKEAEAKAKVIAAKATAKPSRKDVYKLCLDLVHHFMEA